MSSSLITTGGTVAYASLESRMLSGQELSDGAGQEFDQIRDLHAVPSWDLALSDILMIASAVRTAIDDGHNSVVVTHGTDTMEETAWLTDLLLGEERRRLARVIFTGAMRFWDVPGTDGPSNLVEAHNHSLLTCYLNQGVQVSFASQLHSARWAQKIDAYALDAFSSGGRPSSGGPLPKATEDVDPDVRLVIANSLVRQDVPSDSHGVVLCGTGAGHVPSDYFSTIEKLTSDGVPVVIATRTRDVSRQSDGGDILYAGDLTAEKAVLALMVALGTSRGLDDVRRWWRELLEYSMP